MSQSWPVGALGEVIEHRKEFIEIGDAEQYKRCRVQLHAKGIVLRDVVSGADIRTKRQQVCRTGEFLVAEIDAKLGGFGIVPEELEDAIVSSHYFLFTVNETKLERSFLDYYIRTATFQDQVTAQGSTNYAAIRPQHVLEYTIPLPPLDEQRRIVARIEALAGRVTEAQRLRAEALAQMNQVVSSLHQKLSSNRTAKLGDLLVLDEAQAPVTSGGDYPQVGVRGFGNGLFAKESISDEQTSYKHFNRLYEGALVLSQVKGWEGAIAVADKSFAGKFVSPEYRTFRCIAHMASPAYLARLVVTPWFWKKLAQVERGLGGRRQRTKPEQFLGLELLMPTYEQQLTALPLFQRLDALRPLQSATQTELDALLPAMLDKAFRGEL